MKKLFAALTLGGILAFNPQAHATVIFTANLDGSQEVPSDSGSTATGIATLTLNDAQTRLEMLLELVGLDLDGTQTGDTADDVTGLHIHRAPFGANGGVVFGLISPASDLNADLIIDAAAGTVFSAWDVGEGNGTTLAAELPNLLNNGLYFNVHTNANPGGEIRGQIMLVPEPSTLALLGLGLAGLGFARKRKVY